MLSKSCQLVLGTKVNKTVLTECTSWKTATYFLIVSYGMGFIETKVPEHAGVCGSAVNESLGNHVCKGVKDLKQS